MPHDPPGSDSTVHSSPPPQRSDKVPVVEKAAYALGGVTDLYGHWLYNSLAMPVFNIYLGLSPALVGQALMITRLFDGFLDPFFGWWSDNTRSRWGRRRPFILVGSILAGLALPLLFWIPAGASHSTLFWFMVISLALYTPLISCFNMPYQSLGAEMTPDYNERTSIMSWRALVQKIAGIGMNFALVFATGKVFLDVTTGKTDVLQGARYACLIAGLIMVVAGIFNFLVVKERYYVKASRQDKVPFMAALKGVVGNRPFLMILGAALFFAIPAGMVYQIGLYTTIYHVYGGNLESAAATNAWSGTAYGVMGFIGVPLTAWLSKRWGKTVGMQILLGAGILSYVSSWWLFTPAMPWLCVVATGFQGLTATGVWVLLPSMCIDAVDHDEMTSEARREGIYVSIFSWVLKVGLSLSMGLAGGVLGWIGFDAAKGGAQAAETLFELRLSFAALPSLALLLAMLALAFYPLSPSRMKGIREALEKRRGCV